MKKKFYTLLFALLAIVMQVQAQVVLNAENFPDANFRAALAGILGINEGDEISQEKINATKSLDVTNKSISDLKGIENFTALTSLYCFINQLTALDVSKNTALIELLCSDNQLTTLDVSKNTALTNLSCYGNKLTTLDVSKNTALTGLYCGYNQLTTLDISKNTALTILNCDYNQLTTLDVSKNTALTTLYCYYNQLTALDVSKNTALTSLTCYNNQIKGAQMDALVNSLPTISSGEFYVFNSSDNSEGNVCTKAQVAIAKSKGWNVYQFNGTAWPKYEGSGEGVLLNAENFPDANFRAALADILGINEGDEISQEKINATTWLDVISKNISDLKGIEHFTALDFLFCSNNQLTALDVSKNTALTLLDCSNNQLTTLDVSKNTALTSLECGYNQLTTLDVSKNTALTTLYCYYNQLTALDVSKNTALTILNCDYNQLTALDVSKNTALTILNCDYNQLTALDVSKNTALTTLYCYYNQLTALDVSKNTALTTLDCYYNQLTALDVSKNTALTTLDCYYNQLTALDVSKNTALTTLDCYYNQLTALDVSKNTALTYLNCYYNQLTALDVSKNTALTYLDCSNNQLTTLDVGKNTALTTLYCNYNKLTTLDVSKNTALTTLYCSYNQLTALDVSKNTALTTLSCADNQLTTLDVSKNTALIKLYCSHNQLTALDLSKNTALTMLFCNNNQIKGEAMDALIASLTTANNGYFVVINTKDTNEGNVCTKTQVAIAKSKGWNVYIYDLRYLIEYEGSDELILNEDNFTDSNFRATLSQILGISEDDEITPEMIDEITTLNVSNKTISNLKGIEHFKELMVLYCQLNQIKGADMDNLIASLPTIDTSSATPALNAPRKTSGTWGSLYAYDNTAGNEGNVITTEQVADANAKGWKVYQFNGTAWEEYAGSTTGITIVENNGDATANWYTLDGKPLCSKPEKAGMYVVKMSNGKTKKVMVK